MLNAVVSECIFLLCLKDVVWLLQTSETELDRLKCSYRQAARDAAQAKGKFQDASKGQNFYFAFASHTIHSVPLTYFIPASPFWGGLYCV